MLLPFHHVYSSPPALPPPLPNATTADEEQSKQAAPETDDTDTLLKGINQFMDSKDPETENLSPQGTSSTQADSFIDFGNNKLPALENENPAKKPDIEVPTPTVNLPNKQQKLPIQDSEPISKPIITEPAKELPSLPAPSPAVTSPTTNNSPLPQNKPVNNTEPVADDKMANPTLNTPVQQNIEPASSTTDKPIISSTPSKNTPPMNTGIPEIKAPIDAILPQTTNSKQKSYTGEEQAKPTTSTPIPVPVFVQDQRPIENVGKDLPPKKIDTKQDVQKEKPNKSQKNINLPNNKKDLSTTKKENAVNTTPVILSQEAIKFIKDETQVLLLPNDDVVLGVLTEEARLEQMDMYAFFKVFKQLFDKENRTRQRQLIDNFINSYDLKTIRPIVPDHLMQTAFESVKANNLFILRTFVNNYQILQKRGEDNYTLLHEAAESGNYYMAKFLIMRGININAVDDQYKTALDIAEEENNNVSCIIRKAQGR